jgi:hypothetical protein
VSDKSIFQKGAAKWSTVGTTTNLRLLNAQSSYGLTAQLVIDDGATKSPIAHIGPKDYCDPPKDATEVKDVNSDQITLTPRSLEGIFQFLGDIARVQLKAQSANPGEPAPLWIDVDAKRSTYPFRVVMGRPSNAAFTVERGVQAYSIVTDPTGDDDKSTRVVQLLTDLLALQSSAKDLPTPNAISILSR